ncbi:MAG: BrnA antitoxin family protein [Rugosibacter sp.]|nr:BrnA antitoxin family protein [Rugosibacter sp.]
MSENKRDTAPWADPDDAPELTDEFFKKAVWQVAERTVTPEEGKAAMAAALRRGRPKAAHHKEPVTLRLDADVLERWRASGKGWQTRAAQALAAQAPGWV